MAGTKGTGPLAERAVTFENGRWYFASLLDDGYQCWSDDRILVTMASARLYRLQQQESIIEIDNRRNEKRGCLLQIGDWRVQI